MIFDIIMLASKFHANVVYSYLLLRTNWPLAKTETGMAGVVASKVRRQRSKNSGPNPGLRDGREEWEKRRQVSRLLQSGRDGDKCFPDHITNQYGRWYGGWP